MLEREGSPAIWFNILHMTLSVWQTVQIEIANAPTDTSL